jgi:uncharacterized protein YndB with AHSA1/START domain
LSDLSCQASTYPSYRWKEAKTREVHLVVLQIRKERRKNQMKYMLSFVNLADEIAAFEQAPEQMRSEGLGKVVQWGEKYATRVVASAPLSPPASAKVVRFPARFGDPVSAIVTDGPFLESKEIFQGFCLLDAADEAEAIAIAKEWPGSRIVEIRATVPMITRGAAAPARAVADLEAGKILASVEVATEPERAFRSLASPEITSWWVRAGVFDTREWSGDVRVGGRWHASGVGRGRLYELDGEFTEVDAPRRLAQTWQAAGAPGAQTALTYVLEPTTGGTRITLRHEGFNSRETCEGTAIGWETSLQRLAELLAAEAVPV